MHLCLDYPPIVFSWKNDDVVGWLAQVRDHTITQKDVVQQILSQYGISVGRSTVSQEVPEAPIHGSKM